jgi:glycosyltransferase involved in cell wall biosynthesis
LRALARVRDRFADFEFHVLGHGDPSRYLELARSLGIEAFVNFCGTLPAGGPVRAWLDAVDIYVQPSWAEGLPRSLLEALSRGCPALGSSVGGIPELLESRCLHRPGDDARLAQLLLEVREPHVMLELARRNFTVASQFAAAELDARRRRFWSSFANGIAQTSAGRHAVDSAVIETGSRRRVAAHEASR